MRRGYALTGRAFRDLIRRHGYPCTFLQADDTSRDATFNKATKRARGYKAAVTSRGLPATAISTLCVRQVADSLEHMQLSPDGVQVRGKAALYFYKEQLDPASPYDTTGVEIRVKPTDEFIVLPGTNREVRYVVSGQDFESIEVYEDSIGDPICWIAWVDRIDKAAVPSSETQWSPQGAL